jgi:EVE domain
LSNVVFECRKCRKTISSEEYKTNHFCPRCGVSLRQKSLPKHWVFQFNPSIYQWFNRVNDTEEPEQWLVSQHAKLIQKGDLIAIWSSGQKSGIYALGQAVSSPSKNPLNPNQKKYFLDTDSITKFEEKHSVFVEYCRVCLDSPLFQDECNKDPILRNLQVFINPQGTNFRLTSEQWDRIVELTEKI